MSIPITALSDSFERKFFLDPSILPAGAASSLTVSVATGADVALALAKDKPFPTRPNGVLPLAGLAFALDSSEDLKLQAGPVQVSVGFSSGAGIYDSAAAALASLDLPETPAVPIHLSQRDGDRFAVIRLGYQASGKVSGTHPLGAVGTFTFGASAVSAGRFAVVQRFAATDGAATVMQLTASSFRLPRHVGLNAQGRLNLAPGCWLIAEVDGNASLKLGARLGYHFSFLHEARLGGLSGDLGLKLDAGLSATFGLNVSGKLLAVVGRPADDTRVRLQLFKQKTNGMDFGLNLKAGVTATAAVPEDAGDFVSAVFGVHGTQIAKALKNLAQWTDKKQSVGELVAGLANERAMTLLKAATGIDPAKKFDAARSELLGALNQWDALPGRVSSRVWKLLSKPEITQLTAELEILADPARTAAQLEKLIASSGLTNKIESQWLQALAEDGLLALANRLDFVRDAAQKTLGALQGGLLQNLKQHLDSALSLDGIRDAVTAADFRQLDSLLTGRLSLFLDTEFDFSRLNEMKNALHAITTKQSEIFAEARKALNHTYTFELTSAFHRASTTEALFDAEFDLSQPSAFQLFRAVMTEAQLDRLLVEPTAGVRLEQGSLSHGITRTSFVEVSLPMFNFRSDHANRSLAKVRAQDLQVTEEAGRVLVYDLTASDEVRVRNQYKSKLSVALNTGALRSPALRLNDASDATWSYRLLYAKLHLRREELESYARPFMEQYLAGNFRGGTDLSTFYTLFDAAVEDQLHNGKNEFGDVLTSMEVSIPGSALSAWLAPMDPAQRKAATMRASRAIQAGVKRLLPFYFFQDLDRLDQNSAAAALLVWASMKPSTSVSLRDGRLTFNTDDSPYWDFRDLTQRSAMAMNPDTVARLGATLAQARRRLQEAGENGRAAFFDPSEASDFLALGAGTNPRFDGLLFFEAEIVAKAAEALHDLADLSGPPSRIVERLAEFGADLTEAFHHRLDGVYADKSALRALGQVVFLEASKALNPSLAAVQPRAMITMTVLAPGHTITPQAFLDGGAPEPAEIALEQRLVSA
ncbi:MAG: hypothetical protein K2X03_18625 [Bryobacteraceae bacterium]|nr:hypothetical protein [Bryobacteraceae bacterium]